MNRIHGARRAHQVLPELLKQGAHLRLLQHEPRKQSGLAHPRHRFSVNTQIMLQGVENLLPNKLVLHVDQWNIYVLLRSKGQVQVGEPLCLTVNQAWA
jgi:hypothetical protein